jgi:hypothetical protein
MAGGARKGHCGAKKTHCYRLCEEEKRWKGEGGRERMGGEELSESRRMRRTRGSTDNRAGRLKGRVSCGGPATVQLLRGRVNSLNPRSAFLLME